LFKSSGIRWEVHVVRMGRRGACKVLVEKPEGMRQIGRLGLRYKYNIKTDLEDVG
jgi:hypothetical protein